MRVSRDTRYALRLTAGMVLTAALINYATPSPNTTTTRVVAAVVACVVQFAIIVSGNRVSGSTSGEASLSLRDAVREVADQALAAADATTGAGELDGLIPVSYFAAGNNPRPDSGMRVTDLVDLVAANPVQRRLVVVGPAGSGKTVLIHRLAERIAARHRDLAPVIVPLATYDWQTLSAVDWLATVVEQSYGVPRADVRRLLSQRRLVLLLDGLDEIPDRAGLRQRALPDDEGPLLDRLQQNSAEATDRDPRAAFLHALAQQVPAFVVTYRTEQPPTEAGWDTVVIGPIAAADARTRFPEPIDDVLAAAAASPLYLSLARRVTAELGGRIPPRSTRQELSEYLWSMQLGRALDGTEAKRRSGWNAAAFRSWFTAIASAASARHVLALSFQRLPLLFSARARVGMRVVKAVVSAAVLGALAWPEVPHRAFGPVVGILAVVFLLAGEGSATRSMAVRTFTLAELVAMMARQWAYAVSFLVGGVFLGSLLLPTHYGWFGLRRPDLFTTTSLPVVLSVTVLGAAMLAVVPALYELFYVDHQAGRPGRRPVDYVRSTAIASILIGTVGGSIALVPIGLVLHLRWSVLLIPVCIVIALIDSLGTPCLAGLLLALGHRGPVRLNVFLEQAARFGLLRPFGPFYLVDHPELSSPR